VAQRGLPKLWIALVLAAGFPAPAMGHDIPNQRVDRSIQVTLTPGRLAVDYEVSLTELTLTQDLRALIGSLPGAERSEWLSRYGEVTAPLNAKGILVSIDGRPDALVVDGYELVVEEHPRYTFHFHASLPDAGRFTIHDTNYQSSEGTSRLAVRGQSGVVVEVGDDLPSNVEEIPIRPTFLLSDDEERRTKQVAVSFRARASSHAAATRAVEQPAPRAGPTAPHSGSKSEGLQRISQLLDRSRKVSSIVVLLIAMGLGAAHAIQPGHGKTLVTAVALGPRARLYQPALLGLAATLAHTGSVLLIAVVLWLTGATQVGDLHRDLTKLAGFAIAAGGFWRIGRIVGGHQEHVLEELRSVESDLGIVGLGLVGGIVPCWDAVGLLVLAAAIGRLADGVALVLAFSMGMAAVLVSVGCLAWKLKSAAFGVNGAMGWQRTLGFGSAVLLAALGLYLFAQA
jgi:nickel/cobalt transporter (NicO) family protein